jgi:hypothetical protein
MTYHVPGHMTYHVPGHMLDPFRVSLSHDHMQDPSPIWCYETLCPKPLTLSPLP